MENQNFESRTVQINQLRLIYRKLIYLLEVMEQYQNRVLEGKERVHLQKPHKTDNQGYALSVL